MNRHKRYKALPLAVLACVLMAACGGEASTSASVSLPQSQSTQPSSVVSVPPQADPVREPLPLATDFDALTGLGRGEGMLNGQRPVAVMVSNSQRSMPQRGLAAADVLVEMVTEGGITRLMAMYSDYRTVPQVGPVRSTRDQFVQMAFPTGAIAVHIGTSVYARNLLTMLEYKDVDGLQLGTTAFWFDAVRGAPGAKLNEYCWFTDAGLIWQGMEFLDVAPTGEVRALFNFSNRPYEGQDEAQMVYATYSAASATAFVYDAPGDVYYKMIDGVNHADEDGAALNYDNVFLLRCNIGLKTDGMCAEFDFTGGDGFYFTGGKVQPLTWEKGGANQALRLFDDAGKELRVRPGKSYIGFVPMADPESVRWDAPIQPE